MKHPVSLSPSMRKQSESGPEKPWFRVENATVDENTAGSDKTVVYIYDEIGSSWWGESTSASDFVKLLSDIKSSEIELHLNSPGGDIFDGFAIYNALKAHSATVTVIVDAMAASAASFIAQAGDKIIMTKASTMMIHDGSAGVWGPAATMREVADLLDKFSNIVADIYASRAGETSEFWRNLMVEEVWYNAQEAVDAGLADEVGADTKKTDQEAAQNRWNLSVFNHAGRETAPDPAVIKQRIANQLKEASVTHTPGVKNDEKEKEVAPADNPETQTTEGQNLEEVEKERQEQTQPVSPENPAGATENKAPGKFSVVVNGQSVTDSQAVQNHINALETFRNETIKQGKLDFVTQLATDNKIGAAQIEKMQNYALSITDEAQYEAWRATWEDAVALPMMNKGHGGSGYSGAGESQTQAAEAAADEITVLKETVASHKAGGMKPEVLQQTGSYKRLMELDPTFKL